MKQWFCALLAASMLFTVGCADRPPKQTSATSETEVFAPVPQELPGVWASADDGELEISETITFYESGDLVVSATYRGSDAGTLCGTYRVEGDRLICDITEGAAPFQKIYRFRIDGRELTLTDDDGDATYLRTS